MIVFDWEKFKKGEIYVRCQNEKQVEDFFEKAKMMGLKRYRREINIQEDINEFHNHKKFKGLCYHCSKNKIIKTKDAFSFSNSILWLTDEEEIKKENGMLEEKDYIDLLLLNENTAIRCRNKNNVRALFKRLKKKGIIWKSGHKLDEQNLNWGTFKENTCYEVEKGKYGTDFLRFGSVDGYIEDGYDIIEFEEEAIEI